MAEQENKRILGANIASGGSVDRKRVLLDRYVRAQLARNVGPAERISPRPSGEPAPLSFNQQQIWLHAQLVPEIPIYNELVTIRRRGTLNIPVLERTLSEIVRRHQVWRTTFTVANGEPVQVISPASSVPLRMVDLSQLPAPQKESEAQKLAVEDALRPFDLSRGPLFRTLLVQFSEVEHRLFLTLHHIIFDGHAIYYVFIPELAALYEAFSHGQPSPLPELSCQYADFARAERDWFSQDSRLATQLAYWRKQLSGNLPILPLPFDRPRPPLQSFRGAIQPVAFSRELCDALKLVSRRERATLFMGLMAAFAVLLHRYSASEDVIIGTVSSRRKRSELEGLLGYFLNPVVLRNNLSGDPTFRELLSRTRELTLAALSNDDVPFTHVVKEVHPDRSSSFSPLFQVLLQLEPPLPETQSGWTTTLTQSEADTAISKFDLCLELDERPSGIVGRFKYSTDLFDAGTIARMAGHLTRLLESAVSNPDQPISKLLIITEQECQQVCVECNNTAADYPTDVCLHELFIEQAERVPDAVAVVAADGQLTYRELHQRSCQLAAILQQHGIAPGKPVGLFLEPSLEMAVGILAVLEAGGACVPLDPSYPAERLEYVLADTQLSALLVHNGVCPPLPLDGIQILSVDSGPAGGETKEPVYSESRPEHLAFVFFTSGSTGKPKGVQITHGNLVHSTYARSLYYGAESGRFLLLSSFSFDSSLVAIFSTLCQGGTLVLTPGPVQSNLPQLTALVEQHQISHLLCVPSLYSFLLEQARPSQLASLRVAIVAGESCPVELVARHYEMLPQAALFNEYGPTEATVWSTVYKCSPGRAEKYVPIGRPIPNTRVYVLDAHLNPLPVGMPGELYIGGPGVARGYFNRPRETEERFIPDPFCEQPGARLYKTGDLVRYLPDGDLDLLGRLDHQVKIRGFRMELEEIEATLQNHPNIQQAVVVARTDERSGQRLVAYFQARGEFEPSVNELRDYLKKKLPDYMIPSLFVAMKQFPLTTSGKIDRKALPVPNQGSLEMAGGFIAPRDLLEQMLAQLWARVIKLKRVGRNDNFFDLGGHSLLAVRIMSEIETLFGKCLPFATLLQAPTVGELADVLRKKNWKPSWASLVPVRAGGSKPPLFLMHSHGGNVLEYFPLANRLDEEQPVYALQARGLDGRIIEGQSVEEMAASYLAEIRSLQPEGPYFLGGYCSGGILAFEAAQQLAAAGEQVALLVMIQTFHPACVHFKPGTTVFHRWWYRSRKRIDLERENFSYRGKGYILERCRRGVDIVRAKTAIAFDDAIGNGHNWRSNVSMPYILERLAMEHNRARNKYVPSRYAGDILLFRANQQLLGLAADFSLGWKDLVAGELEICELPGHQEQMLSEPHVTRLAEELSVRLRVAQQKLGLKAEPSLAVVL